MKALSFFMNSENCKNELTQYTPLVQHHQLLFEFEALLYILLPDLCTTNILFNHG
ncbi:hypothetical protein Hanom_Chr05g00462611 [Helianthus anomalus]